MWERYDVSELFAAGIKRFIKDAPDNISVKVFSCVSDERSKSICDDNGFESLMIPNNPVGKKWNTGLDYCLKNFDFDYVLIMGDDDLISSEAWSFYMPYIKNNNDYFGFGSLYFYEIETEKSIKFEYSSKQKLVGCGRMISRKAIEKSGYYSTIQFVSTFKHGHYAYHADEIAELPSYQAEYLVSIRRATYVKESYFNLWSDKQERGLDNESEIRLLSNGFNPISISTPYPLMTDCKTSRNINHFDKFIDLSIHTTSDKALSFLPEDGEEISNIRLIQSKLSK